MNLKIVFFVFIFMMSMSGGPAMAGSRFSLEGVKSNFGDFTRNLRPLSEMAVQDPLSRLNAEVDAAMTRVKYHSHFGSPGYRFYHRSPGPALHFNSPGYYLRYGYGRPFFRAKPYDYYYRYRPYRYYYKHRYFRYYLPPGPLDRYWHHRLNDFGNNLGLPWYCR